MLQQTTEVGFYVGALVRIRPQTRCGTHRHFGRGKILSLSPTRKTAAVLVYGRHRRTENFALSDLHPWRAGNAAYGSPSMMTTQDQTSTVGQYVVMNVTEGRVFVNAYHGFKPEFNRAKQYDTERGGRLAAAFLRKRPDSTGCVIEALPLMEAKRQYDLKWNPAPAAPTPERAPAPVPMAQADDLQPGELKELAELHRQLADLAKDVADKIEMAALAQMELADAKKKYGEVNGRLRERQNHDRSVPVARESDNRSLP